MKEGRERSSLREFSFQLKFPDVYDVCHRIAVRSGSDDLRDCITEGPSLIACVFVIALSSRRMCRNGEVNLRISLRDLRSVSRLYYTQ